MRICHLTSVHDHTDIRIFIKECRSLALAGYEVHFVVPEAPDTNIDGVQIHGIVKEAGSRLKRMTATVNGVLKKGLEIDADVYHFHDPELIPVGLQLKRKGKKVIYDVHEDVPRQILTKNWIPKAFRKVISKSFELLENFAAKRFDFIITATPYILERFLTLGCRAQDIKNYPLLNELKMEDCNWSEKEDTVCYMGGISVIRGIREMVTAQSYLENITILLGGHFTDTAEKTALEGMNGWEKVKELGFLNRKEVKETYQKSKAGIIVEHPTPNHQHALPIKMFEYMAAGIPVISSDIPLWRDIVEGSQCGICVDPFNPNEIAEAIEWIISHPQDAENMGRNGRKAVETTFNWEIEGEKLAAIYRSLLQNSEGETYERSNARVI